jgi:OmpA-OmpF porin, OOP family
MASKKYTLITALLLAATTGGFSQLAGVVDYKDSSKVPSKRMAQQNEWRNNSLTQSFPARPRDMWQLGVYGGLFVVSGDCPPLPGWNVGIQARKALGYVFSIRGQVGYGVTKGLDYRKNPTMANLPFANMPAAAGAAYRTAGFYVPNFKNTTISPSVDVLASLNNIMFHKKSNKVNFYVLGGFTEVIYKTEIDLLDANGNPHPFPANNAFYERPRKDIRDDLKDILDDEYETDAKVNDRSQNFDNPDPGALQIRHSWNIGGGLEYRLSPKASLGLELKYVLTPDDYLDAWQYQTGGVLTSEKDNLLYGNFSVNFNIGNSAKKVAPLWWLNPLGYVYSELSNPTIMKFPKPVLDDTDNDGVTDQFDIEPNTPAGCPVDTKGKSRDTDGDGVPDCRDKELITPTTCQPVDADGVGKCPDPACCTAIVATPACNIGSLPSVQFTSGVAVNTAGQSILDAAAAQIKANPACKICVVGHGGASKREQQLSWDRVESVINYLVEKQGISRDRFVFKYGEEGDSNTVDLQDCSGEEGPNMVPAPHPQYRKGK